MKEVTIKICGKTCSGKSTVQYHIIKELRKLGFDVDYVPDIDYKDERDFENRVGGSVWKECKIKVETVTTK